MPHVDDGTLHALLDGALRATEPDRADRVEAHLAACDDCHARLEAAADLRDDAGAVLDALDDAWADADAGAPAGPDFQEVLARARTAPGHDLSERRATFARRYRWTRGAAWAATIVIALGTGYIVRDMAGPRGEVPRTEQPATVADEAAAGGGAEGPGGTEEPGGGPEPAAVDAATGPEPAADEPATTNDADPAALAAGRDEGAGEGARAEDVATGDVAPRPTPEALSLELAEMPSPPDAAAGGSEAAALRAAPAEGAEERAVLMAPAEAAVRSAFTDGAERRGRGFADLPIAAVGCYSLEPVDWGRQVGGMHIPPPRFELMDSVGTEGFEMGRLLVRPVIEARSRHPMAYWEPVGPDSVHVTWTNGFGGARLLLQATGDVLIGRARFITDAFVMDSTGAFPDPLTAAARATRIPCGTMRP